MHYYHILGYACAFLVLTSTVVTADPSRASLLNMDEEHCPLVPNPWSGVDANGAISVSSGQQYAVDDDGKIAKNQCSPSVAVGDLNGDGLPDLVVADPKGFLWFFPNKGTKTNAIFGQGEVMPIWFGSEELRKGQVNNDVVPRIQLIDVTADGLLDLVVGTFDGSLYVLPNTGTKLAPNFQQPSSLDQIRVPTRKEGRFWCNYLAPCLYNWSGSGVMDLILGEGTYSSNSIYLLQNKGSNVQPSFSEDSTLKIIPGMGKEHLTPCVVDWNGDGKPDIISGERQGYLDLFLNTTTDADKPTFAESHVRVAGQDQFGKFTTVTVADLNHNNLPNLIVSNNAGSIVYAANSGTAGSPAFASSTVPLKSTSQYPKIYQPSDWKFAAIFGNAPPFGSSYECLAATSAEVEKGFTPPPDHIGKFALRSYVVPPQNNYFKARHAVDSGAEIKYYNEHGVGYKSKIPLQTGKRYALSFSVRIDGNITSASYFLFAQHSVNGADTAVVIEKPFDPSSDWSKVSEHISWQSGGANSSEILQFSFTFRWQGDGSIYFDDISLTPEE